MQFDSGDRNVFEFSHSGHLHFCLIFNIAQLAFFCKKTILYKKETKTDNE